MCCCHGRDGGGGAVAMVEIVMVVAVGIMGLSVVGCCDVNDDLLLNGSRGRSLLIKEEWMSEVSKQVQQTVVQALFLHIVPLVMTPGGRLS